jgi:predicted DNA-binding protein with PD1-like motif
MTSFMAQNTGRVLFLHLTKGDDLLKSIENGAREAGIQTGVLVSGIGSLRRLHYHYIGATTDEPNDTYEIIEKPMELACLQGIILEGKPHLHGVVTEQGVKSYSGHLEEGCEVQYLVEVAIIEVKDMPLGRRAGQYGTVTHFEWLDGRP